MTPSWKVTIFIAVLAALATYAVGSLYVSAVLG